jgi:hypothetical protein
VFLLDRTTLGKLLTFSIFKIRHKGVQKTYTMMHFSQMACQKKLVKKNRLERQPRENYRLFYFEKQAHRHRNIKKQPTGTQVSKKLSHRHISPKQHVVAMQRGGKNTYTTVHSPK